MNLDSALFWAMLPVVCCSWLLVSFKQQVMVDESWGALGLIGVETPSASLVFVNHFWDAFVVTNLYTIIFFQSESPSLAS